VASGERNLELTGPADGCVQLPGAGRARLDIADWPIMFAPKPLLMLAGRYDFVDYSQIESATAESRRIYTALGKPDQLSLFAYDDGHGISQPKREAAVAWFRQWFFGDASPVREGALATLSEKELRCTATGQVNTAFRTEANLGALHVARAQKLADGRAPVDHKSLAGLLRQRWSMGLSDGSYENKSSAPSIERRDTLRRLGMALEKLILRVPNAPPLPALLALPAGSARPTKVVVWLPERGKAALVDSAGLLQGYLQQGAAVLLGDLRGLGETTDPAAFNDPKYYNREYRNAQLALHTGQPLLAQRVADVFTLLAVLQSDKRLSTLPFEFHASGPARAAALHAAVLEPGITRLVLHGALPSYQQQLARPTGKDTYSDVLPGVLRHYDVPDLQRALGSRLVLE
jgi:hypothetical protein